MVTLQYVRCTKENAYTQVSCSCCARASVKTLGLSPLVALPRRFSLVLKVSLLLGAAVIMGHCHGHGHGHGHVRAEKGPTQRPPFVGLADFSAATVNTRVFLRYDADLTLFSPEGKLYQVEYVMKAVGHYGCPAVGVHGDGCCVVACKRDVPVINLCARRGEGEGRTQPVVERLVSGPFKWPNARDHHLLLYHELS